MKSLEFWNGALAALLTIASTVAIRRLLLVPVFHVTEMTWSTAFVALASFNVFSRVLKIGTTALRLTPSERRDPKVLSDIFGAPVDKLRSILNRK